MTYITTPIIFHIHHHGKTTNTTNITTLHILLNHHIFCPMNPILYFLPHISIV